MSSSDNPFAELERYFERMSEQFEDASRRWRSDDAGTWPWSESVAVDLVEHDDAFVATVDLPGFEHDDVDVSVTDHTLRITAEREQQATERDDEGERVLRRERQREAIDRSVRVPAAVDRDGTTATMRNGVLTVTLPKADPETAQSVDISVE